MQIQEQVQIENRANHAMRHLEQHPKTRVGQLGAARDQMNIARTWPPREAWDAIQAMENIVVDVYGHIPNCATCTNATNT